MSRMPRVVHEGKRSKKSRRLGKPQVVGREEYEGLELDSRLELIRELVPLGLMHVQEELDREVVSLAGERYMRKAADVRHYRHGTNPGTVRVLGQRLPIEVPRVRGPEGEVRLQSYGSSPSTLKWRIVAVRSITGKTRVRSNAGWQQLFWT